MWCVCTHVHACVCVCMCVCVWICHHLLSTCETVPFAQPESFPYIDSGDIWEWKEATERFWPLGCYTWMAVSRLSDLPMQYGWPSEITIVATPRSPLYLDSLWLRLPPLPPASRYGAPCLSLIVATHLATPSMICLPSCFFSNSQTHLEAVLLRQRVIVMAPKIKQKLYNCKTGVA